MMVYVYMESLHVLFVFIQIVLRERETDEIGGVRNCGSREPIKAKHLPTLYQNCNHE